MMKRWIKHICIGVLTLIPSAIMAQGLPFIQNYSPDVYQAHNQNFDILAADNGIVYVANFEGLLYYDKAEWHIIHTPGITRITTIYQDQTGRIWTGGYNFVGYLQPQDNGTLCLQHLGNGKETVHGEVDYFWEANGHVYFRVSDRQSYVINKNNFESASVSAPQMDHDNSINQVLELQNGLTITATNGLGITMHDKNGRLLFHLTEDNGLCNNIVNRISYDGHGTVWGATDKGIFTVAIPSRYSRFSSFEGLKGEVSAIQKLGSTMFVGTFNGVFQLHGMRFEELPKMDHACWQIIKDGNRLLAATSNGVYAINESGAVQQLSNTGAMSVITYGKGFLSGEIDGVYYNDGQQRTKILEAEKVVNMYVDKESTLWLQNLYGHIWNKPQQAASFSLVSKEDNKDDIATMVIQNGSVHIVRSSDPDVFPQFSYADDMGYLWMTNHEAKHLTATKEGKKVDIFKTETAPFDNQAIRTMLHEPDILWIGGEFGIVAINQQHDDDAISTNPKLRFLTVRLNGDSIMWGAMKPMPDQLEDFSSNNHNIEITYALDYPSLLGDTKYRSRLNEGSWSAWSKIPKTSFTNLAYGSYTLHVQAIDAFGRISNTAELNFTIRSPFYMQWYMYILYLLLLAFIVNIFFKWRTQRLEKEKQRLEKIVSERTAEVTRQKDEIQEKSDRLQEALTELSSAQKQLIRQEKMATAGKLTQGLIDRILNPMNYINNFSKLSCGLLKDLKANIEEEKEHMDQENYEDTIDVIAMIDQNLHKVEEHGINTTRTLKAMEEILKDRTGGMQPMSLLAVIRQNEKMVHTYYDERIQKHSIDVSFILPDHDIMINGNADQISKTFMSMLGNAIYAVEKKCNSQLQDYGAKVSLRVETKDQWATIYIYDNGTGITQGIISKIFDPFFTTKTTSEASGVGLYLSHEIMQNHGGDITVTSVKDEYTEFKITLPILQTQ